MNGEGERSRKKIGINLSKISRATGYSVSHLSRVFRGKTNPSLNCLKIIGEALNVNMHLLYRTIREGKFRIWKNN